MKELEKGVRIRIRLIGVVFVLGFALVTMRAFDLQVLQEKQWNERAERQHQKVIPLTPQRGTIFDSNGEELAVSVDVDSIYAEPRKLEDHATAAKKLAKALGLSSKTIRAKLKGNNNFVWLKRQVSPSQSESVKAMKLKGVGMIKEPRRFYPNSNIAAHLIGFTGLDPKGLEGVLQIGLFDAVGQHGLLFRELRFPSLELIAFIRGGDALSTFQCPPGGI